MSGVRSTVILADDEPDIRALIMEILEAEGLEVLEACDGTRAVELIKATAKIDLVLTDINMPGCDGYCVAQEAHRYHPKTPILFVSGRYCQLQDGWSDARCQFVAKPFSLRQLLDAVTFALSPAVAARQLETPAPNIALG